MTATSASASTQPLLVFLFAVALAVAAVEAGFTGSGYPVGAGPKRCLASRYRPSNFTVEIDQSPPPLMSPNHPYAAEQPYGDQGGCTQTMKIYLTDTQNVSNKTQFFIKGVGYSPILASKRTFNETFDYFSGSKYRYLWNRDLPRIKAMGANTVRVWNWNMESSHTEFLDLLHELGLYIIVPFDSFTIKNYPDLQDVMIRQQILMDWRAFLNSISHYPAVLGYTIGNELNLYFSGQREGLFSIINSMVAVRNEIDPARHPVTLPLADSADLKEMWFEQYYNWAAIDFWSVQSYRPDAGATQNLVQEYYKGYLKNSQSLPLKPLVFTEFGTDALVNKSMGSHLPDNVDGFPLPVVDQRKQAAYLCSIFSSLRDTTPFDLPSRETYCSEEYGSPNTTSPARVVAGVVLMEWNDEWWKAEYADVRAKMCPSDRSEIHNDCAHNIGNNQTPNYIHEEWLGITAQKYDPSGDESCLCPRYAYEVMSDAFGNCSTSNCTMWMGGQLMCSFDAEMSLSPEGGDWNCSDERKWCATNPGLLRRPQYSIGGPLLIIGIVLLAFSLRLRQGAKDGESVDGVEAAEAGARVNAGKGKRDSVADGQQQKGYGTLDKAGTHDGMLGGANTAGHLGTPQHSQTRVSQADSQVFGGGRDTVYSSHYPFCAEKQLDAAKLESLKRQLRRGLATAFHRFTEVEPSRRGGGGDDDADDLVEDASGGLVLPPSAMKSKSASRLESKTTAFGSPSVSHCNYFRISQEKLFMLIWDKFCGMECPDQNTGLRDAVGIVFRQMMEGYHVYRTVDATKQELGNLDLMLEQLALYSIVTTWAGTINHSPEKVCEVFEFSLGYFDNVVPRHNPDATASYVKDFHHGLVEIMRAYYLKVDQAEFSFDDINTDALIFRKLRDDKEIEIFWKSEKEDVDKGKGHFMSPLASGENAYRDDDDDGQRSARASRAGGGGGAGGTASRARNTTSSGITVTRTGLTPPPGTAIPPNAPELDLLPIPPALKNSSTIRDKLHPYLEYHKQSNPEDLLLSCFANSFFALHAIITKEGSFGPNRSDQGVRYKKFMDREDAFPLHGGPFTIIFNYGWIIRYLIWQWIIARFFQPVSGALPICACELTQQLALADSGWQMLSGFMHRRVLGRFRRRVVFECSFYTLCFIGLVVLNIMEDVSTTIEPPSSISNAFMMGMNFNTFYVVASILITTADEIILMTTTTPPYGIPARFRKTDSIRSIRIAFVSTLLLMSVVCAVVTIPWDASTGHSLLAKLNDYGSVVAIAPDAPQTVAALVLLALFLLMPLAAARLVSAIAASNADEQHDAYRNVIDGKRTPSPEQSPLVPSPDQHKEYVSRNNSMGPDKTRRMLREEANQLGANLCFWFMFFVGNFVVNYYILVPSVKNITFDLCRCDPKIPHFDHQIELECSLPYEATCSAAVIFVWVSAVLVSFTVMYSVFSIELLIAGFFRAKYLKVGNIKSWEEVEEHWLYIHERCLPKISRSLSNNPAAYASVWNTFMEALYKDSLLSIAEKKRMLCPMPTVEVPEPKPNLRYKPRSEEAFRRITYHMWSLESASEHKATGASSTHTRYREQNRVRTMPPWTVLIPTYDETVIFPEAQLRNTKVPGKSHFRISELEYLVHTYADEWDNFAERIKETMDSSWVTNKDTFANDLMEAFISNNPVGKDSKPLSEDVKFEVRWWATMRGQTLARTVAGMVNWRDAIVALMKLEEPSCPESEIQEVVSRKCQILVSHQTANPFVADVTTHKKPVNHEEALELLFRRVKYFEVAYNDDSKFQSVHKRVKASVLGTEAGLQGVKYLGQTVDVSMPDGSNAKRKKYNYYEPSDYDFNIVQRVGRLRIGEGKAENQVHALQFVRGAVLQAMDMNQYTTTENGFKVPYLLSDYFGTPALASDTDGISVIPEFRILGFPEWAYTRTLSMVGEFMGAAEWCFVTITQRVLDWPLRMRAHYGHPDFFDAYWVRNRGGQSKASRLVNTNEDIFAAYEMFGRGDRGAFVEFLEAQKGRESTFGGACVFEAKLAMGGAQQVRSFDIYRLNRNLTLFDRFALCFSSLAFYFTNFVMAVSVMYYMLSIALFAVSGVSFHRLGLMDSAIAIPWLFQIGYVLALPYIVELTIQFGFLKGFATWLRNLPAAIIFFVFHLRTKMYFFSVGILIGKGGYAATGRGFGLDRTSLKEIFQAYSSSHFKEAILILAILIVYAIYGSDPVHVYIIRCMCILLIVLSWIWAPVLFNPASTASDLENDVNEFVSWMVSSRRVTVSLQSIADNLRAVHVGRVLHLVNHLEKECREVISATAAGASSPPLGPSAPSERSHSIDGSTTLVDAKSTFAFHDLIKDIPDDEDYNDAFNRVLDGLAKGKPKLTAALKRLNGGKVDKEGKPVIPSGDLNTMINKDYWGDAEKESWIGWYLKGDVLLQWEAEDQFFPGLINLITQKAIMNVELFAPWIILASDRFHISGLYFMGLIVGVIALNQLVLWGFKDHHQHIALGKAALLLPLPFAIAYYLESTISFAELVWSLILFNLTFVFFVRTWFGISNALAKYKTYGLQVRPFYVGFEAKTAGPDADIKHCLRISVTNRSQEAETTNQSEENRLRLFRARMEVPLLFLHSLSIIVPILCLGLMTVGNFLVVLVGSWITTMNLNGRVSEAWKKAYLRPPAAPAPVAQPAPAQQQAATGAMAAAGVGGASGMLPPLGSQAGAGGGASFGSPAGMPFTSYADYGGMVNPQIGYINSATAQAMYAQAQDESFSTGSISASLMSHAGASMRAVRTKARGTAASQSVLGRGMNSMIQRPSETGDGVNDDNRSVLSAANTADVGEPFIGATSRILLGDQAGYSSRSLGRK